MSNNPPIIPFDAAKIRAFIDSSDEVAKHFSFIPQVAYVDQVIVPILDGGLKVVELLQSGAAMPQLLPALSDEFHNIANALHTPVPTSAPPAEVPSA